MSVFQIVLGALGFSTIELYFFFMQRSLLDMSRAQGIDSRKARQLLPSWYILAIPTRIVRWMFLYFAATRLGLTEAFAIWAPFFAISMTFPVPHSLYQTLFMRRADTDLGSNLTAEMLQLYLAAKGFYAAPKTDD